MKIDYKITIEFGDPYTGKIPSDIQLFHSISYGLREKYDILIDGGNIKKIDNPAAPHPDSISKLSKREIWHKELKGISLFNKTEHWPEED